jgi:hypothetical protein
MRNGKYCTVGGTSVISCNTDDLAFATRYTIMFA